jgi:D-serine deaminase-like pyridoxal phosphate-dependent protein
MGNSINELETPIVLIDLNRLESNLKRQADLCIKYGIKLRPHIKTHKSIWIMQRQLELGACGITTAKLGEAEVMAEAGARDILIAYPILGKKKLERLRLLLKKSKITVSTDSLTVAKGLSDLGESIKSKIPIYVDVNSGLNRCGLEPGEETALLVEEIQQLSGVVVTGLMTHAGHAYGMTGREAIGRIAEQEAEALISTQKLLFRKGINIKEMSVGSTPTAKYIGEIEDITETRPGAYVFGDGIQLSCGIITEEECALYVLATVVSMPQKGMLIIDSGSKTFSSDLNPHRQGYGILKNHPEVYIEKLSEEHGVVKFPEHMSFSVGDQLKFLPNHCCTATNLHDTLAGVKEGQFERSIRIDARGKIR